MSEDQPRPEQAKPKTATVIKKYANRRLYNTATSTYVTLEDLAKMVKEGVDFVVFDAKSGDDITRSVLAQIIFEEEGKDGNTLLPVNFLRQLIRFYGDSMQGMVPGFLEFSMGNLTQEQDKLRQQMGSAPGGDAYKLIEETAKRNMQLFQDSLKMFTPFGSGIASVLPVVLPVVWVVPSHRVLSIPSHRRQHLPASLPIRNAVLQAAMICKPSRNKWRPCRKSWKLLTATDRQG